MPTVRNDPPAFHYTSYLHNIVSKHPS